MHEFYDESSDQWYFYTLRLHVDIVRMIQRKGGVAVTCEKVAEVFKPAR